jgi:hypothetical protein
MFDFDFAIFFLFINFLFGILDIFKNFTANFSMALTLEATKRKRLEVWKKKQKIHCVFEI